MLTTQSLFLQIVFVSALIFSGISFVFNPYQVQAQSAPERIESLISSQKKKLGDASGRIRGGATRGGCFSPSPEIEESVIVLGPKNNVGSTIQAFPTFFFYLRFTQPSQQSTARFILRDEQGNALLKEPIFVEIPESPGIFSLTLPSNESAWVNGKSLEIGQRYQWFLSIICHPDKPSSNVNIHGWIERVELSPDLENRLQNEAQERLYNVYQENGIWYEAITQLAQNRDIHPEDWANLLAEYELSEFSQKPITEFNYLQQF